ncbi:disease resistance protein RPM1 [Cinnamomum micranthum f. kanehirae]|uniref:Disease resistance protein RPM1 n=1 Tax=Cinnamomum micranthum f. kanehirae TaxID=337451 RepID=A0A443P260_9MAGN|nr:disease resistance protein RPM1 [Cinnamomum micranthum f. kanehirae]
MIEYPSLIICIWKDMIPPSSLHRISSTFRKLRVLDLQDASIHSVPDELAKLFNLRYLSLRNTNVRKLPKSLGRLRNLETLDTRNSKIKKLPAGINNMKSLRHLYMYCYITPNDFMSYIATQAPSGICKLNSLQTLMSVEANTKIVRQVGNLSQLRRLDITKASARRVIFSSTPASKDLFNWALEKLPHWIGSLANLSFFYLDWSKLQENPFPLIGSLLNLVFLWLNRAYDGQRLHFLAGCFPSLKRLALKELKHLNHVKVEQGAMPSIQEVTFLHYQKSKILPEGIEHLSGLQELFLREMPEEFTKRLRGY